MEKRGLSELIQFSKKLINERKIISNENNHTALVCPPNATCITVSGVHSFTGRDAEKIASTHHCKPVTHPEKFGQI